MNFEVIKQKMNEDVSKEGQEIKFGEHFLKQHSGVLNSIRKKHKNKMILNIGGVVIIFCTLFFNLIEEGSSFSKLIWCLIGFSSIMWSVLEMYLYNRVAKFTNKNDSTTKKSILEQIIHLKELDDCNRYLNMSFSMLLPYLILFVYTKVITSRESLTNDEFYTQLIQFERPILEFCLIIFLTFVLTFLLIFNSFLSNRVGSYKRELFRLKQLLISI